VGARKVPAQSARRRGESIGSQPPALTGIPSTPARDQGVRKGGCQHDTHPAALLHLPERPRPPLSTSDVGWRQRGVNARDHPWGKFTSQEDWEKGKGASNLSAAVAERRRPEGPMSVVERRHRENEEELVKMKDS